MSLIDRIANTIAPGFAGPGSVAYWLVMLLLGGAGIAGLLYGRRFFWIFAGLLGFVAGQFVSVWLVAPVPIIGWLFQVAIGVAVGLLAVAFPWTIAAVFVVVVSGAAVGEVAYLFTGNGTLYWLFALLAGLLGALALHNKYDETMFALTASSNAFLLAIVIREVLPPLFSWHFYAIMMTLLAVGLVKQALDLRHERREPYLVPVSAGGVSPEKLP